MGSLQQLCRARDQKKSDTDSKRATNQSDLARSQRRSEKPDAASALRDFAPVSGNARGARKKSSNLRP